MKTLLITNIFFADPVYQRLHRSNAELYKVRDQNNAASGQLTRLQIRFCRRKGIIIRECDKLVTRSIITRTTKSGSISAEDRLGFGRIANAASRPFSVRPLGQFLCSFKKFGQFYGKGFSFPYRQDDGHWLLANHRKFKSPLKE